jgi:23S rRNA (uracil1939-C5)-methyltransferase
MKNKNNIIEQITIEDFAAEARSIARVEGKVIFVEQSAPGDVADLRIIRKKKNFLEAVPVKFHRYSGMRQDPVCEHFDTCGGCSWQHVRYAHQLEFKYRQVRDQLERIGKLSGFELLPIIGSEKTEFYRNKLEYTFSNQRWLSTEEIESPENLERNGLGFHKPGRFDKVLDIHQCHLQSELSNDIRNAVKNFTRSEKIPYYDLREHTGFLRNLIVRTSNTGGCMVILQVKYDDRDFIKKVLDFLKEKFPEITSFYYIVNPKLNESYQDLEVVHYAGDRYLTEKMEDLSFIIGPKSFFQTNSGQALRLYSLVREMAEVNRTDTVYDLYSGTGSIALFLSNMAEKVIGIEYIEEAVSDARQNAAHNRISNVTFIAGDIKDIMKDESLGVHGKPDVIITDPPRAGMHPDVIRSIIHNGPDRIVYVSCNPATQARDIDMLRDHYRLVKAQPVDMFPHTHHIENIALLKIIQG